MKYFYVVTLLFLGVNSLAQIVDIPDTNFKNALLNTICVDTNGDGNPDDNADINDDNEIQVSEAEAVLRLFITSENIASLEGIQYFVNLEWLLATDNQLTNVDISQNINLQIFFCGSNPLTDLDVTQNTNLEWLWCRDNPLTNLDVTQNINLEWFYCTGNQITSLDVTQNINLERLICYQTQLTSLDLTQNTNLERFFCVETPLTSLNIKNGNNINMTQMWAYDNPFLTCIQVDDEMANYPACSIGSNEGWCIDSSAQYSEDCSLGTDDFDTISFTVFPNPAQNVLNIQSKEQIRNVKIFSLHGSLIKEVSSPIMDVSQLSSGLYFAQVSTESKTLTKRFIKS